MSEKKLAVQWKQEAHRFTWAAVGTDAAMFIGDLIDALKDVQAENEALRDELEATKQTKTP